ncbi:MAG: EVE domain-containing protein [Planctomycetes bacterium]|nr:EVE domain-containing protein [Planctomycetota bacterium]MCC7171107.1 EVE domain-containing protein [Planctomycetota bacterium]
MANWLLKTEPSVYAFEELVRDKKTAWDGVANNLALIHLRAMVPGDRALVYHTDDERAAIGTAQVTSKPYADPNAGDPKLVVVDVKPVKKLPRPVTLAQMKANPKLEGFELFRNSRLSVVPVTDTQWDLIVAMSQT